MVWSRPRSILAHSSHLYAHDYHLRTFDNVKVAINLVNVLLLLEGLIIGAAYWQHSKLRAIFKLIFTNILQNNSSSIAAGTGIVVKWKRKNPWQADGSSEGQEILRYLWNPKIYYRVYIKALHPAVCLSNASDLYSKAARFESRPERLSWLRFFVVFLSPSR
jgi:hypothetical protein